MKEKYKKIMRIALAFCMTAVMLWGAVADAQAAGYQKAFTKTVTIKGGQCMMTLDLKEDTKMTVKVSTGSKNKNLNIQAIVAGVYDGDPYYVNLDSKHKKGSFSVSVPQGTQHLYVTNYSTGKVKVKIKVSVDGKVLKYIKKEMIEDVK